MNTEIYIESNRLDVSKDLSTLLNFAIDDVKDFGERSTTWSKTIVLPGTANNNRLFGHIFEIGQSNFYNPSLPNIAYNFNASKSVACLIFQDNMQTFKGVLRLLEIISDRGNIEYEVAVFGEIASLNVALSSKRLEDLDFSEYNHSYTVSAITDSWDNPGGSGVYYPLIDYGTYSDINKHDWNYKTFRPALYVKEYLDKMFNAANFRYQCNLFETERFKKLIIPNNRKALYSTGGIFVDAEASAVVIIPGPETFHTITFPTSTLKQFTTSDNKVFTYTGPQTYQANLKITLKGTYFSVGYVIAIGARKNNSPIVENVYSLAATPDTTQVPYDASITIPVEMAPGDNFNVEVAVPASTLNNYQLNADFIHFEVVLDAAESAITLYGEEVDLNFNLPKNIRQIDFLVSIVRLFNLYIYEDQFDSRLIHITPFIDFYNKNADSIIDWTYKLDRSKPIKLKPMAELNAKIYEFKYKSDSDYWNELYKKRYSEDYGSRIFDSEFEFAEQKKTVDIIFSPTPLIGYGTDDKVYSTIFKKNNEQEETIDSNIRILQTMKVMGVSTWGITDNDGTILANNSSYGYAGHLDNPDAPSNDLNFGALKEIFFTLAIGNLSPNQFNVYWSDYMAEITDKDSKLLSAKFRLTPKDIYSLDFSKYIHIDGALFRLNKIADYNASNPDTCTVELFRSIYSGISTSNSATALCQAVIMLTSAQVLNTGGSIVVEGIGLSSDNGVIQIPWTPTLKNSFGILPVVWVYFNGQMQAVTPVFDNSDSPNLITFDLGVIPDTNTYIVIPCSTFSDVVAITVSDIAPNPFTFNAITNAELNSSYESMSVVVSGINSFTSVSITGGEFAINGGSYSSLPSTVKEGDNVQVRILNTGNSYGVTTSATLTIGGLSGTFSVTTKNASVQTIINGSGGYTPYGIEYRASGTSAWTGLGPGGSAQVIYKTIDIKIQSGWSNVPIYINNILRGKYKGTVSNIVVPENAIIRVGIS